VMTRNIDIPDIDTLGYLLGLSKKIGGISFIRVLTGFKWIVIGKKSSLKRLEMTAFHALDRKVAKGSWAEKHLIS
jgi:hypothetical protein